MRVLSLGAGVQSTAVALMALAGELPPLDAAIFADTGWEPPAVYGHLWKLADEFRKAGVPLYVVSAGNVLTDHLEHSRRSYLPVHLATTEQVAVAWEPCPQCGATGRRSAAEVLAAAKAELAGGGTDTLELELGCPRCAGTGQAPTEWATKPAPRGGMAMRKCTKNYKVEPIIKLLRTLVGLRPRQRVPKDRVLVRQVFGISLDEYQRMRTSRDTWIVNEYPLVDRRMTRATCTAWLQAHGWTATKSACIGCPFHSDATWREMRDTAPADFAQAVHFDAEFRARHARGELPHLTAAPYLHRSLVPLAEVPFDTPADHGQGDLFTAECEGHCGV